MKTAFGNLLSGVCGALLVLAATWGHGYVQSVAAPVSGVQDCITARKLVIVDEKGVQRISLCVDDPYTGVTCWQPNGVTIGASMSSGNSGSWFQLIAGPAGNCDRVQIGCRPEETGIRLVSKERVIWSVP